MRCGDLSFAPKGHSQGSPGQSAAAQPRSAALGGQAPKTKTKQIQNQYPPALKGRHSHEMEMKQTLSKWMRTDGRKEGLAVVNDDA
jgi:hypothetical protein